MNNETFYDKGNSCPYYLPIKCTDRSFVESGSNCSENPIFESGKTLSPDESCLAQNVVWPSENGYPVDIFFHCVNGE